MILVTGATGFIGRSLTNRLTLAKREWQAYNGRINNPQALRDQLEGVEVVFHLAGTEERGRNRLLRHVDIDGTERLLEECTRADIKHLIVMSRMGADPNSIHGLLQAKGVIERMVRQSGVPYTIVRATTLYGRDDRFLEIVLSLALWSWPFVWLPGGGEMMMQPLWVEDLTRCLVATLHRTDLLNKTITLAGEEHWRYQDIVREILRATGYYRVPIKFPLGLLRPLTLVLFRWWSWPAINNYFVDRFFVPEVTRFDTIHTYFGFHPSRLQETITYLNRSGMWRRLFRR